MAVLVAASPAAAAETTPAAKSLKTQGAIQAPIPGQRPQYKDPKASLEDRVESLLGLMTLDEKIAQLSGVDSMDLPANERLGIPRLKMTDGPLGVRVETAVKTTAFPAGILSASSFDPTLVGELAAAMAVETLALGRDMLLGPCINITRVPHGGRNFESFGEDPFLAARMGEAWVVGLQSKGVISSTKHYALNNQEIDRGTIDVRASERAIHEIFLPAFEAAVRAGTWTIMAAYNKINGQHASENQYLQNEILKGKWGFRGFIVSDWGATHSTVEAANLGLDVEMPSGDFFGGGKLQQAIKDGKVTTAEIDDKTRRVLRVMFQAGVFNRKDSDRPSMETVGSPAHRQVALKMAEEGIVLLKNDGILPLASIKKVAIVGPNAPEYRRGGGSSAVPAKTPVSALDGFKERAGKSVEVFYARGVSMPGELKPIELEWLTPPAGKEMGKAHGLYAEYFDNPNLSGAPIITQVDPPVFFYWGENEPWKGMPKDKFSMRWTGRLRVPATEDYVIGTKADDGTRLWIDGKKLIDDWTPHAPLLRTAKVRLEAGVDHDIKLEYFEDSQGAEVALGWAVSADVNMQDAVDAAAKADAAVVFAGYSEQQEGEAMDRESLELPEGQDKLISEVARVNKNVIVVLQAGSPVLLGKWKDKVRAIVQAWYPGQEGGYAMADVLLGRINPSGKLPVSWPKRFEDTNAFGNYPGTGANGVVNYAEGIYVGYRHYDKNGVEPEFPFGFGLSYTTFKYGNLAVRVVNGSARNPRVQATATVTNTGKRAGAEIVQLYVAQKAPKEDRPPQELKGFARVELKPGETKRVSFALDKRSFARYDAAVHDWVVDADAFEIRLAASSRDVRLKKEIALK
ncbi:MAG: glycoside hydrolase family 3 C-terminal domain-containing protein [Proteobacteria bacterium]|nr:glycoside hydrolase family 3 C-terminal domain-containing protein [Pseudomonadota bacterium]